MQTDSNSLPSPTGHAQRSDPDISLKKMFLFALIGSVSLSALLGIASILFGDFGDFEVRVLLTSLTISAASLCGLSCGAAFEAKRSTGMSCSGMALAVVSALLICVGIWGKFHSEDYWRFTATVAGFAVACGHMCLLLMARLAAKFEWATWAAYACVFGVALIWSIIMWGEIDDDPIIRIFAVAAILDAAITILIPIFHRLSQGDLDGIEDDAIDIDRLDREIRQLETRLVKLRQLRDDRIRSSSTGHVSFADASH